MLVSVVTIGINAYHILYRNILLWRFFYVMVNYREVLGKQTTRFKTIYANDELEL